MPEILRPSRRLRDASLAWSPAADIGAETRGISDWMKAYGEIVDEVAGAAIQDALRPIDRVDTGSNGMASSNGNSGPTPDRFLTCRFRLKPNIRRAHIGQMGCF